VIGGRARGHFRRVCRIVAAAGNDHVMEAIRSAAQREAQRATIRIDDVAASAAVPAE
jgi:hypothetical protein